MDEKDINRELDEMLVMLKTLENKLMSEPNVTIRDVIDIYTIHLAELYSYYDMSEALEFIQRMYYA
jgi:hypothetical protein